MKRPVICMGILVGIAVLAMCTKNTPMPENSLDASIERAMEQWQIPGLAVVVVKDGETVLMKGYGTREFGKDLPVDEKTYLQIASNSKTFNAYLYGMLVDDGVLEWDDPIKKHIPEFYLPDAYVTENIAIDDLQCHRSGLTDKAPAGFLNRDYSFDALMNDIKDIELPIRFRSGNYYTNTGMAVLGEVVNRATGQSWGENIRQRIFDPLGMTDSYTSNHDFERRVGKPASAENIMQPAVKKGGVVSAGTWDSVGTEDLYAPAGGIISTMEDMAKWIAFKLNDGMHAGGRLISLDRIEEIRKIRIPTSFANLGVPTSMIHPRDPLMGTGYGHYSFEHHGNKVIVHNGGWMASVIEVVPEKKLGVGVFSNAYFYDLHGFESPAFVNAVALTVIDHYLGHEYVDWSSEMLEIVKTS